MSRFAKMSKIFVSSIDKGLAASVQKLLPKNDIVYIERHETGGISKTDKALLEADAEVLLADVPVIMDVLYSAKRLKWSASTWAGVENLMKGIDPKKPPGCVITRSGGAFNKIMAEYVLGQIIVKERFIVDMSRDQEQCKWNKPAYSQYRSVSELTLGILGVGEIGTQVARLCNCAGMRVIGVTRTIPDELRRSPHVSDYKSVSELAEVLKECDYVCNILPSTPGTQGLLSGDIFSHCKHKKSVFINIGRGDITDDDTIVKAINAGWLGGAILDVFREEPLPVDSPLWKLPGVVITPHIAGVCLTQMIAEAFVRNYNLYLEDKPLEFQVDLQRGY